MLISEEACISQVQISHFNKQTPKWMIAQTQCKLFLTHGEFKRGIFGPQMALLQFTIQEAKLLPPGGSISILCLRGWGSLCGIGCIKLVGNEKPAAPHAGDAHGPGQTSLLLTLHWLESSGHTATPNCKGGWEVQSCPVPTRRENRFHDN